MLSLDYLESYHIKNLRVYLDGLQTNYEDPNIYLNLETEFVKVNDMIE